MSIFSIFISYSFFTSDIFNPLKVPSRNIPFSSLNSPSKPTTGTYVAQKLPQPLFCLRWSNLLPTFYTRSRVLFLATSPPLNAAPMLCHVLLPIEHSSEASFLCNPPKPTTSTKPTTFPSQSPSASNAPSSAPSRAHTASAPPSSLPSLRLSATQRGPAQCPANRHHPRAPNGIPC